MIREAYKVEFVEVESANGELIVQYPLIIKVPITDREGLSWQGAKKQLRNCFLADAAALRSCTKEIYFAGASIPITDLLDQTSQV